MFLVILLMNSKSLLNRVKTRLEVIKKRRSAMQKFLKKDIAELLKSNLERNAYGRVFYSPFTQIYLFLCFLDLNFFFELVENLLNFQTCMKLHKFCLFCFYVTGYYYYFKLRIFEQCCLFFL